MTGRENIEKAFSLADAIDRAEGLAAYENYHQTMRALAEHYDYSVNAVAAVFASLSPNNDYVGTLRSTASVLIGVRRGHAPQQVTVCTYNHCKYRAFAYARGDDFLSSTRGPKIRAFYKNIIDPSDPDPVTIDGHMVGCWLGRRMTMVSVAYAKFNYDEIADGFRDVARSVGILPCQVQGVVWFVWKRIHNVLYSPQLDLFRAGNQWKNRMRVEEILPYPERIQP